MAQSTGRFLTLPESDEPIRTVFRQQPVTERQDLLFVSTRFLFPVDSGGKIRTVQILRGLMGGQFRIRLMAPASAALVERFQDEIASICDEFLWWPEKQRGRTFYYSRLRYLGSALPIPVRTDVDTTAQAMVTAEIQKSPSIAVFDFLHAAVLMPDEPPCATLLFTHNVEAELFRRHYAVAGNPLMKAMWKSQYRKMHAFEKLSVKRFDNIVAVADRDRDAFVRDYGLADASVIPTGVDLDFFSYSDPVRDDEVVFCGSMDWLANQRAMLWFLEQIWPEIARRRPAARMTVVGRSPPASLVRRVEQSGFNWSFTGYVDDVREHMRGAAVSVIPLTVGGGTRLKAFESMAMGIPLVSTTIGVEGLNLQPGEHFVLADDPSEFAGAVLDLLADGDNRLKIAADARRLVEDKFSYEVAAESFAVACNLAIARRRAIHADR